MSQPGFTEIAWGGRRVRIEHVRIDAARADAPLMVFLHEGLGSVAMWNGFPRQLCEALGMRGLVYSRPGYGQSSPRPADQPLQPDFMHRQAHEVLPALLSALGETQAPWLYGHSDGGSIALLHATRHPVAGLIVAAPHILVEPITVAGIERARDAYESGVLRRKLARYHDDVDGVFWGWNHIWLDPAFRAWSIEGELAAIPCPVLAVQGLDDEYGTLEQVHGIARRVPGTRVVELPDCGHSAHRDQPQALIEACHEFFEEHNVPAH